MKPHTPRTRLAPVRAPITAAIPLELLMAALLGAAAGPAIAADDDDAKAPLDTVVVTASPIPTDPDKFATIVERVNREQILQNGGANLADALADQPGITGTGFASGASRPVIRGFDANRVRVLEDGIGSFDVSDVGPDHGVPIDPLSAQRIEVVRGAATLRYGSQAIGGVVNAINDRVPTTLPTEPLVGELTGSYGSSSATREGSALLDGRLGQFAWHADAFDRRTGNYDVPDGSQPNSWFRGDGYSAGGSYFLGDNRIGLGAVHYDAKYGIPSDTTFIDMNQTKLMTRSSFAVDSGSVKTLTVEGGYADYQHSEIDPATSEVLSTFRDKEWDVRSEALFGAIGPLANSALGLQVQRRSFQALGDGASYLLPTTTKSSAAFLFSELPLNDATRLQFGARVERVNIDGTPASGVATTRDFTPTSASAGLVWDASSTLRLGLTATSAARAPGQTELFARGPHDGPGTYETGDPTLRPERANSLEASLRLNAGLSRLEASLWGAKFKDYIYGDLTGRTCDDQGACVATDALDLRELVYGQLDATFRGVEAKWTRTLHETPAGGLRADLFGDYVRATLSSGGNVPRIPPWHAGGGLHWDGNFIDGGVFVKYSGRQDQTALGETETGGFVSLDAHLGWRPLTSMPGLQLLLIGHNLTDSTQRNAVALNKDQILMPGRDLRLTLRADF